MTDFSSLMLGLPGFSYPDLHHPLRLRDLSLAFDAHLKASDPNLFSAFECYRIAQGDKMTPEAISHLLVQVSPHLSVFIARLFCIESDREARIAATQSEFSTVFTYKNEIVAKVASRYKGQDTATWDIPTIQQQFAALLRIATVPDSLERDKEKAVACLAIKLKQASEGALLEHAIELRHPINADKEASVLLGPIVNVDDSKCAANLYDLVCRWTFIASRLPQYKVEKWVSFKTPLKTDFSQLVDHKRDEANGFAVWTAPEGHLRHRDGFALTDPRFKTRDVLYEVDHCIYCHDRNTDSCAKGMRIKGTFKSNPLGVTLTGCPLEEKISEMHVLKRQGDSIGALALITIDNPMCPGTGHRICNDCMKGCIYQKTEPVNIPQIETNVLTDVLFMPWGFEIYSLLTRWNPLNIKRPYALPYNGYKVLVAGMGPAGYTLSHYLLNEGFSVVGIDGLKIEPLPKHITGDATTPPQPIRDFHLLYEDLDKRVMLGFGGVAEYGITVRWDKNFLKVIYLNLIRRSAFRIYGGVRFGGTLTINEAWDLGFDHIAIASGAGKPTLVEIKNNLTRGIRQASDFLMALQLTGAAKESSLANLQVRLPAGVIGGGLTAIDTCTEVLAYYPKQVEKVLHRYEKLCAIHGREAVNAQYDEEETEILEEFLEHGRIIQAERERAEAAGETPRFLPFLEKWGGVTLFYRKAIEDSPAYRQNAEEIREALAEGIRLVPGMNPLEAFNDKYGHLRAVQFEKQEWKEGHWIQCGKMEFPLKSLFIAAGTSPNTIYESEHPDSFEMDKKFYQRYEPDWSVLEAHDLKRCTLEPMHDVPQTKIGRPAPFTSYRRHGRFITFYGDNHPVYAGNVVKAMASAKDGYPYIVKLYERELSALDGTRQTERDVALRQFQKTLDSQLLARIIEIHRITPTIIEVIVRAPLAAKHFCPGQFYRVQNFEALAPVIEGTVLASEGLALTGAWVDKEQGLISLIALEMGSSSRLLSLWKPGDPLVIMGVTGAPTEIYAGKTVALLGGGLGNAVLFSIGKALRAAGSQVIYFAAYRKREDVFKVGDIEAASDIIVWSVDNIPGAEPITPSRSQDKTFVGNIVEAMVAYAEGALGATPIHLDDVEHLIVIGSDRMMAAVKAARFSVLQPYLTPHHSAIGSINSPMQCMMKGVCAQCLCKHVDPKTGKPYFVYSCYNQDQELDRVDFPHLNARLRQNSVQEKLSGMWLAYLLEKGSH